MTATAPGMFYALRWDIDGARGHLDTAICQVENALGHVNAPSDIPDPVRLAACGRLVDIFQRLVAELAHLDELREVLADR